MRSEPSSTISSNDAAEQEIADQDRRLVAPDRVGGIAAAAQIARIDDIVMQQGRGVDELDRGGEGDVALAAIAAQPRAGQGQHRPQPLAAAGDDMAGELRDQRHRALHALDDQRLTRSRSAFKNRLSGSSEALSRGAYVDRRFTATRVSRCSACRPSPPPEHLTRPNRERA